MIKKCISIILSFAIISAIPFNSTLKGIADDVPPPVGDEIIETTGLISYTNIYISTGTKKIHMNMYTNAYNTMSEIGFIDIDIERSLNNVNFTHERYANNNTITNADSYHIGDYSWNVSGGYYYRVTLNHYARNGSLVETIQINK